MKTKINKILGVALALVLVFGLAGAFIPVNMTEAVGPGTTPNQWQALSNPSAGQQKVRSSDVADIAVGADGKTIYAVDTFPGAQLLQAVVTSAVAWTAAPGTYTITYTNQAGVAGLVSAPFVIPAASVAGALVPIVLVGPDTATDVTAFTVVAASAGGALDSFNVIGTVAVPSVFATCDDAGTYRDGTEAGDIMVSPNNGGRWTVLPVPGGFSLPPRLVAVAPDDPNAIAVVDSSPQVGAFAAGTVWISNNGGTTWAALARVPGAAATNIVTGVTIGPARSGTILNRDYAVSVADAAAGCAGGDVFYQGLNTAWTSCVAAGVVAANTTDFTSITTSPGFLGDRCFVAIGHDLAGAPGGFAEAGIAGDTWLFIIQTSDVAPLATLVAPPGAIPLDTATSDSPSELQAIAGGTVATDVALPADFDPTTASGRRSFVSWTSFGGPGLNWDDAYRVDNQTVRKLQTGAANGIWSIAYSGTITGGTLIAGEAALTAPIYTAVHHTEDPQVSQPSWATSTKSPTGQTNCVVAIDPADGMVCYAGTTGVESAFSASKNGGISFNNRSCVNTAINGIADIMLTPDGSGLFMATWDAGVAAGTGSGSNLESLWYTPTPPTGTSWERVRVSPANWGNAVGASLIRLSPEYLDVPSLYWCMVGGAAPFTNNVQRSVDGGNVFSGRTPPAGIADLTVENADIIYMANGANIFVSTNGAWFFGLPIATGGPGAIYDLEMAPTYPEKPIAGNLIAGYTAAGGVMFSNNAAASWRPLSPFVGGGTNMQVTADEDFANNNTVYAGNFVAGSGIWRYAIGTSTVWEGIHGVPAYVGPGAVAVGARNMRGMAMSGGTLYGCWSDGANSGVSRSLVPDLPVIASWIWEEMDVGGMGATFLGVPNALRIASPDSEIHLYAIDTTAAPAPVIMAYNDTMAKLNPELAVPDEVPVDSVTGRSTQFTISWPGMSNATDYEVQIHNDPACSQLVWRAPWAVAVPPPWYVPSNPLSPTVVVPPAALVTGQDYFVRARARDQVPNDAIRSPWSSVYRFSVEGGERVQVSYLGTQPLGPVPGATGVPLSPGFTWSPYADSTRYEFKLARDAALTDIIAEAKVSTTGYKYDGTLDNNTTYFWAVRGIEPTSSDWSPVASFTTEKKVTPPPPPVVVETPPPAEPVVSQTMIYVIIGVGVVLVIAVIVLIVRTRRTV